MGYVTEFRIHVVPDAGYDESLLLKQLDERLGELFGGERPSYNGWCDETALVFSGKFYELCDQRYLGEATRGLPGTFQVDGVGEEHPDIWRVFARDGVTGKKHQAVITLPIDPDVPESPVTPTARALTDEELRAEALRGDEAALTELLKRRSG